MNATLVEGGVTALLFLVCLAAWLDMRMRAAAVRRRLKEAAIRAAGLVQAAPKVRRTLRVTGLVAAFGSAIASSGLLPTKTRAELERTVEAAGLSTSNSLGLFIGTKIVLALALPVSAFMATRGMGLRPLTHVAAVGAALVAGLMIPDLLIKQMRKRYTKSVEKGLADGLDMLVICAEAGLALDAAIRRVSVEIVHAHPALAAEFAATSNTLRLVPDPRVALTGMGARTGLIGLTRLGATLMQSIEYGTPLASALRTLAGELRQETLTRFEERAARLPVLLTIPMILFILPCVFLIVAGPIVISVIKARAH